MSNNGTRCVTAPCNANGKNWEGRTDAAGYIVIPTDLLQFETIIETPSHSGDLVDDAGYDAASGWVAELLPVNLGGGPDLPPRPVKLVAARGRKPIANTTVRIDYPKATRDGLTRAQVDLKTNALGYVFVPFAILELAERNAWVIVPAYRRALVESSANKQTVLLEPR